MQTAGFGTTEWLQEWYAITGPAAPATFGVAVPMSTTAPGIADRGDWMEIGGVRVNKR